MRMEKWRKTHSVRVDRGVNIVDMDVNVFLDIEVGPKYKGQGEILGGGSYVYVVDGQVYNNNDTTFFRTIEK